MSVFEARWWRWSVRLASVAAVVLLWTLTGFEDQEGALWRRYTAAMALLNIAGSALFLALAYVLSSPAKLTYRLARVAAATFSVAATFVVLELPPIIWGHDYGQTFGTRADDTWHAESNGINRRDDELIHVHKPHSRFRGTVTGNLARLGAIPVTYNVDVAYDRNGFRNDEDFTRADIVAIGDSFVEGAETPRSLTVVGELGRRLGVTVANLGQSGYGPQQELIVLRRYGLPLAPKNVVWFLFGGNDFSDVDAYEWRRTHLEEFLAPPPLPTRLFARNVITALGRLTTPTRTIAHPNARRREATFTRRDGTNEVIYVEGDEGPWEPHQWEVLSSTLLSAHHLTMGIGGDLLVVYIPRKLRVYHGFIRAAPDTFAGRWSPTDYPNQVAEFCQQHDIPFLDSTTALRAAVAAGESVYMSDDTHWNAAGHRVVATAVAERIQKMGRPAANLEAGR